MSREAMDTVYCNIQMPMTQGRELLELIAKLRELEMSIEFVKRMLAGEDRPARHLH